MGYSKKYFEGQYIRDRLWEIEIGKNIVDVLGIKSMIDLGCGMCGYLEGVYAAGCTDIAGIDMYRDLALDYIPDHLLDFIEVGDITKPFENERVFDCSLSIEVGEHIDPSGSDVFIDNLTSCSNRYIVFTAATPGQRGTGHINLRSKDFWIDAIEDRGFLYRNKIVEEFKDNWRDIVVPDTTYSTVPSFICDNLIIFEKG